MSGWRGLVGAAAALLVSVGAIGAATDGFRVWTTDTARTLSVREHPVVVPPVALLDIHRASHALAEDARSTIVDFVYTRCVTVCGALGATFQRLQADIARRGVAGQVRLLTISFDPTWDTPARLRSYATAMRADPTTWTIATVADTSQLQSLLHTFGVRVIPDGAGGFVHNAALHVVDPQGQLVAILPTDATADAIDLAIARAGTPARRPANVSLSVSAP